MFNILRSVKKYYKNQRYSSKQIEILAKEYSHMLKPGYFYFSSNSKVFLHNKNKKAKSFIKSFSNKGNTNNHYALQVINFLISFLVSIIKSMIFFTIPKTYITQGEKTSEGDLIMLSANFSSIKIFDFSKGIVFHIEPNTDKFERIIKGHKVFCNHYNTTIMNYNYHSNQITEKLIENSFRGLPCIQTRSMDCILDQYIDYVSSVTKQKVTYNNYLNLFSSHETIGKIFLRYEKYIQETLITSYYPVFLQHCDFQFDNLLISNNSLFLIDFEHSTNTLFIVDIFYIFWYEIYKNRKSSELVKLLFNGNYDRKISKIFSLFDLEYHKNLLPDYLMFSRLIVLSERSLLNLNTKFNESDRKVIDFLMNHKT
jgi:thiamine kinase-like enzyme